MESAAEQPTDHLRGNGLNPHAVLEKVFVNAPEAAFRAALIGRGILRSRTPQMHMSEGRRIGLSYDYQLIDFDAMYLPDSAVMPLVRQGAALGLSGFNVTHPFKQAVLGCLDGLSPNAEAIGAVNTVVLRDGKAVGHNTDCWGFAESFRRDMAGVCLDHVLLVGAGGAGMAVGRALLELGASRIGIFDVDGGRSAALAGSLQAHFGDSRSAVVERVADAIRIADGLVNTTPIGMANHPGMPVPAELLRREMWIADVIYFPAETELLQAAATLGCRSMSGRGMAIFQAVRAFELITGVKPDPKEMARHFATQNS
jgi:shikimate dehydrogenase